MAETLDIPDSEQLRLALSGFILRLLELETTIFEFPEVDLDAGILSLEEHVDLRRFLRAKEHFLANDEELSRRLLFAIGDCTIGIVNALHEAGFVATPGPAPFSIPLYTRIDRVGRFVGGLIGTLTDLKLVEMGLCTAIYHQIRQNIYAVSGVPLDRDSAKPLLYAEDAKLPAADLVEAYLKGTPLFDLLDDAIAVRAARAEPA